MAEQSRLKFVVFDLTVVVIVSSFSISICPSINLPPCRRLFSFIPRFTLYLPCVLGSMSLAIQVRATNKDGDFTPVQVSADRLRLVFRVDAHSGLVLSSQFGSQQLIGDEERKRLMEWFRMNKSTSVDAALPLLESKRIAISLLSVDSNSNSSGKLGLYSHQQHNPADPIHDAWPAYKPPAVPPRSRTMMNWESERMSDPLCRLYMMACDDGFACSRRGCVKLHGVLEEKQHRLLNSRIDGRFPPSVCVFHLFGVCGSFTNGTCDYRHFKYVQGLSALQRAEFEFLVRTRSRHPFETRKHESPIVFEFTPGKDNQLITYNSQGAINVDNLQQMPFTEPPEGRTVLERQIAR
jgi:hypothetical protein